MAGLIGCLNAFEVDHVISSDYVHDSKLYTSFVNTVDEKGLEMEHPEVGTTFSFGSWFIPDTGTGRNRSEWK